MTEEDPERFAVNDPVILLSLLASSIWGPGEASKPTSEISRALDTCKKNSFLRELILVVIAAVASYIFVQNPVNTAFIGVVVAAILSGLIFLIFFIVVLVKEHVRPSRLGSRS